MEFLNALQTLIKGTTEEVYIAACLRKYREAQVHYVDEAGQKVDPRLIEASQAALTSKKAGKSDLKLLTEDELKTLTPVTVHKKKLHTDNFIFVGVPIVRVF